MIDPSNNYRINCTYIRIAIRLFYVSVGNRQIIASLIRALCCRKMFARFSVLRTVKRQREKNTKFTLSSEFRCPIKCEIENEKSLIRNNRSRNKAVYVTGTLTFPLRRPIRVRFEFECSNVWNRLTISNARHRLIHRNKGFSDRPLCTETSQTTAFQLSNYQTWTTGMFRFIWRQDK